MPRGKALKSLRLIEASTRILEQLQPATVRAICYRLFTLGLIPNMSKNSTNRVGAQIVYAREQGIIPWSWVVDETREAESVPSWQDPEEFSQAIKRQYRRDRWRQQANRVEVWSEKGTVRGTLAPVLHEYGVTFRVMHGYASATAIYQVARETQDHALRVYYVGDWDPSGLHMSEVDLPARLAEYGASVALLRLALDWRDVQDPDLPWFDAETKRQDPRWSWFTARFGNRCWELDALSPVELRQRVERAIRLMVTDWETWERCGRAERAERESLELVLAGWKEARA